MVPASEVAETQLHLQLKCTGPGEWVPSAPWDDGQDLMALFPACSPMCLLFSSFPWKGVTDLASFFFF